MALSALHRASQNASIFPVASTATVATNATESLVDSLVFAQSKSIRTSTIVLTAFNVLAALATAFSILYDCHCATKFRGAKAKFNISKIHPADTFPLILATTIVLQGIIFASAQSAGLSSIYIESCDVVGQLVMPAIFLVPSVQVVFGLECALRSFRAFPFPARGQYDVCVCLIVIIVMTFGAWLPTNIEKQTGVCFASLLWFVTGFASEGLTMMSVCLGLSIVAAVIIFARCTAGGLIDEHQRIAASRMVYFLVLAVLPMCFVIPWFIAVKLGNPRSVISMMGTVALNLSGLMNGALYVFLRANTVRTAFTPKDLSCWRQKKHDLRLWGPNELGYYGRQDSAFELRQPCHGSSVSEEKMPDKAEDLADHGNERCRTPSPIMNTVSKQQGSLLQETKKRIRSTLAVPTSIFSSTKSGNLNHDGLESIYIAADFEPPPVIGAAGRIGKHGRNSSLLSSATLQFGLRLSDAGPFCQDTSVRDLNAASSIMDKIEPALTDLQVRSLGRDQQRERIVEPTAPLKMPSKLNKAMMRGFPRLASNISPDDDELARLMKTLPRVPRFDFDTSETTRQSGQSMQVQLNAAEPSPPTTPNMASASEPDSRRSFCVEPSRSNQPSSSTTSSTKAVDRSQRIVTVQNGGNDPAWI